MKYRIVDRQIFGRYFADGDIFESEEAVLEHLAEFHSIDFDEAQEDNDVRDIFRYMDDEFSTDEKRLNWILNYGQWALEEEVNQENDYHGSVVTRDLL